MQHNINNTSKRRFSHGNTHIMLFFRNCKGRKHDKSSGFTPYAPSRHAEYKIISASTISVDYTYNLTYGLSYIQYLSSKIISWVLSDTLEAEWVVEAIDG